MTQIASLRIITGDLPRLVRFYEHITGLTARRVTPDFAELRTPAFVLAIGSTRTVGLFGPGTARPADNRSLIVEFRAEDVDAEYARLREHQEEVPVEFVNEPTVMPWGNKSLLVRDPDGTLVNLFTPPEDSLKEW